LIIDLYLLLYINYKYIFSTISTISFWQKSLNNTYITNYIKDDGKLDYQKLYSEMSEITGFMKEKKQKNHYDNIVDLYNTWKKGKELIKQGDAADPNEVPF